MEMETEVEGGNGDGDIRGLYPPTHTRTHTHTHTHTHTSQSVVCRDHKQAFGSLKNVLSGAKLVDSMVNSGLVTTRQEGELLAQDLFGQGVIRHSEWEE